MSKELEEVPMAIHLGRRDFIAAVGAASVWPLVAGAQQPAPPTVGVLFYGTEGLGRSVDAAFRHGLGEQGYLDGRNVAILFRQTAMYDRLPVLYADLVRRGVAIIASMGAGNPSLTAASATATTPVVFLIRGDRATSGGGPGLIHPAGNVAKRLDLLLEVAPKVTSIGYLHNPTIGIGEARIRAVETAARAQGIHLAVANASAPGEIEQALTSLVEQGVGALMSGTSPLFIARTDQVVEMATHYALPAVYPYREQVEAGGLMSYGISISDAWRTAGEDAGRMLKGEKLADLVAQRPARAELTINRKTAKMLDLAIPDALLSRADQVIE
jgi:putative ABC transport system substrate-binding protein